MQGMRTCLETWDWLLLRKLARKGWKDFPWCFASNYIISWSCDLLFRHGRRQVDFVVETCRFLTIQLLGFQEMWPKNSSVNDRSQKYLSFDIMCSSRKYPYPHHGGNFTQVPPSSPEFPFFEHENNPPTPPESPQVLCTPPIPSGQNSFGK